jgi:hypothetical protein
MTWGALCAASLIMIGKPASPSDVSDFMLKPLGWTAKIQPEGMKSAVCTALLSLVDAGFVKHWSRGLYEITPKGYHHFQGQIDQVWDIDSKLLGRDTPKTYKRAARSNVVMFGDRRRAS